MLEQKEIWNSRKVCVWRARPIPGGFLASRADAALKLFSHFGMRLTLGSGDYYIVDSTI